MRTYKVRQREEQGRYLLSQTKTPQSSRTWVRLGVLPKVGREAYHGAKYVVTFNLDIR